MTTDELATKLAESGIPSFAYSLTGGLPNEAYCLEIANGTWQVYYSERGHKNDIMSFASEREACDHLYKIIRAGYGIPN